MAINSQANRDKMLQFSEDYAGTPWAICRHTAKRMGGKFLRGARLDVLAAIEDELGNFFCLTERGQKLQLTREELFI